MNTKINHEEWEMGMRGGFSVDHRRLALLSSTRILRILTLLIAPISNRTGLDIADLDAADKIPYPHYLVPRTLPKDHTGYYEATRSEAKLAEDNPTERISR